MKARITELIIATLALLILLACQKEVDAVPAESTEPTEEQTASLLPADEPDVSTGEHSLSLDFFEDNPIDRAFLRVADERGAELEDNAIFAYLHARQWYNEFFDLHESIVRDDSSEESYWHMHDYYTYRLDRNAIEHADMWSRSHEAVTMFEELARHYRMLAYDCLARSDGLSLMSDEEELYQYLNEVSYADYIPDEPDDLRPPRLHEVLEDEYNPLPALAALPDANIHLSFAPPFGAVLSVDGEKYFYEWSYGTLTPRSVLPQLVLSDFNGDGIDELAVYLYVGSGTEVARTEVHIVPIHDSMFDVSITIEDIERLLYHRLSASHDTTTDIITVRLDDQTVEADLSWYTVPFGERVNVPEELLFYGLYMRSLVFFSVDTEGVKVQIPIGLVVNDGPIRYEYVEFFADIIIGDRHNISLANCRIEARDPN